MECGICSAWDWLTSGDMPALRPRERMRDESSCRVIPTATELSITTVAPGRAYRAMVPMASRRWEVSICLPGRSAVGTATRK